jgi:hypothetical protein
MEMRCLERNTLVMGLFACSVIACAREEPPAPRAARYIVADIIIAITNQTSRDKSIFLEAGSGEHRLGIVPGHSTRSFSVPRGAGDTTSDLRLEARELRTAAIRSGTFRLSSGDRVVWMLDSTGRGRAVTR